MAQSTPPYMGARAQGMGYASACLSDVWSLHNNIAGLATTTVTATAFSYQALPSSPFLNRMGAVMATPVKAGAAAVGLYRLGDDLYNEQTLSAGMANTFGMTSLGLKLNYVQFRAAGLETRSALTASFGGISRLTPTLRAGAHILNINQPVINERTGEKMATRLVAGLSYRPSEKLIVAGEIEKDLDYPSTLKAGLDYRPYKKIAFRTGFHLHPQAGFFGLGFEVRKFQLDYAIAFGEVPGLGHQATATYRFDQP